MIISLSPNQNISEDNGSPDPNRSLLTHYGTCIAQYYGHGELTLKGEYKLDCQFEAGQLNNGDVIILCDFSSVQFLPDLSESRFEGTTLEGYKVTANNAINKINYLPEIPPGRSGSWESILWRHISVQMVGGDNVSKINFGITNFEFSGTEGDTISDGKNVCSRNFSVLPINIEGGTTLNIKKLSEYDKITMRLRTLKDTDVTCEIETTLSDCKDLEIILKMIDNLCYLLSIARGTKIQWIYYNLYNYEGKLISRTHSSRITRPYCPTPVIDHRIQGRNEFKNFIENAYPIYLKRRDSYNLNRGVIDAYLEGKAEGNYLQTRGVKLAVAMEMLKDVFLTTSDASIKEYIMENERFETFLDPLCKGIRETLSSQIEDSTLDRLCCKSNQKRLACLNRVSFRQAVNSLCRSINFIPREDLSLFIYCRDSLIHIGKFYCETATDKQKAVCKPLQGPKYEYFFLVDFLDKIFLKFFDYHGIYISSKDLKFERTELI